MKKQTIIMTLMVGLLCLFALSTSALADDIKAGDIITIDYGSAHFGNGGEFKINGPYPLSTYSFETFCMETDEYFTPGSQYKVASISNQANQGGANTNSGDPLDNKTAWLYWMFRTNPLGLGYDNDAADAGALQNAIWYIEEEIGSISGQASTWYNDATAAVNGGWTNNGRVAVVNIVGLNSTPNSPDYKQDQLTLVPEPTSLLLLGLGLLGVGILRRKQ